jgi:type I restriction enzyme S subunit
MRWETVEIGKVSKVISGFAFKSKDFQSVGIPIIKIKSIKDENIVLDENDCVDSAIEVPKRFHLSKGDIIISLTGSHITLPSSVVGRVAKYRHETNSYLNQRAGKFINIDIDRCHKDYLFYFLLQKEILTKIANKAQGAANQANISPGDVEGVEINLPPLSTQRKIASILSAYDDLIENNLKRVKLLEEQLAIKYSLLESNCKHNSESNFSDYVTFAKGIEPGSNNYLSQELEDSIPFIRVGDLSKRESNIWIERIKCKGVICDENDILISMDGTVGMVKYGINGCYSSGIRKAVSNGLLNNAFIFCYLTSKKVQSVIYAHSKGSTIQHAGSSINHFKIRLPKKDELKTFINYSNSVFSMLLSLHKQNNKLREARDILLPRLMSGQIEV